MSGALASDPPTTASDQYVLSRHVARRASAVRVVLDVDNRLFSPLDGVPRDAFTADATSGLWYDATSGLAPLVLHFNRDAKARLSEVTSVSADGVVARLRAIAARGTLDDGVDSPIETIKYMLSWWHLVRQRR